MGGNGLSGQNLDPGVGGGIDVLTTQFDDLDVCGFDLCRVVGALGRDGLDQACGTGTLVVGVAVKGIDGIDACPDEFAGDRAFDLDGRKDGGGEGICRGSGAAEQSVGAE